jgi:hypothetical protein
VSRKRPRNLRPNLSTLTPLAGCLDQAIRLTSRGEPLDKALGDVVEMVLKSNAGDNSKLVCLVSTLQADFRLSD